MKEQEWMSARYGSDRRIRLLPGLDNEHAALDQDLDGPSRLRLGKATQDLSQAQQILTLDPKGSGYGNFLLRPYGQALLQTGQNRTGQLTMGNRWIAGGDFNEGRLMEFRSAC